MKKLFRGRVRLILLLAVLLAAATALTAALSGTAWGSRTVQAVLTPFRSGFSALTRQAERYYNYLFNYESLSAENDYLRRQISSMENEVRTADSLQRENERLKELLGLQEDSAPPALVPLVIILLASPGNSSAKKWRYRTAAL